MRLLQCLTAVALLCPLTAPAADQLPVIPQGTPYPVSRRVLLGMGYEPAKVAQQHCPADRAEICRAYDEFARCSADARGSCAFLWRKREVLIEVLTTGEDALVMDR